MAVAAARLANSFVSKVRVARRDSTPGVTKIPYELGENSFCVFIYFCNLPRVNGRISYLVM